CRIVGRVTMDQALVDVSRVKGVRRWDVVTLIGKDRSQSVTAQDLADLIQSIPYEVVCSLHSRIPRLIK
ncbi:MAG: alanine racemase C-terminal domain-containing protein, partial [Candidatus Omnitrophota bacterium]